MSDKFPATLDGVAVAIPMPDIDTDTLIPIDFCVNRQRPNFDVALFRAWRFDDEGREKSEFILNQTPYRAANILLAGANFGCGSSREMAVWALADFGIRCVIAPSFGEIFYNNCFHNSVLAAQVTSADANILNDALAAEAGLQLNVDIAARRITGAEGTSVAFELDDLRATMLLEGLDPIMATVARMSEIQRFEKHDRAARPWVHASS